MCGNHRGGPQFVDKGRRLPGIHRISSSDGDQRKVTAYGSVLLQRVRIPRGIDLQAVTIDHIAKPAVSSGVEGLKLIVGRHSAYIDACKADPVSLFHADIVHHARADLLHVTDHTLGDHVLCGRFADFGNVLRREMVVVGMRDQDQVRVGRFPRDPERIDVDHSPFRIDDPDTVLRVHSDMVILYRAHLFSSLVNRFVYRAPRKPPRWRRRHSGNQRHDT